MNINFPLILVILVAITGAITLLDKLILAPRRLRLANATQGSDDNVKQSATVRMPKWIEHARSFFPILLIVLLLRSFLVEPFRIPSGSLEPTLLVGDFVLVNKYQYGFRLPVVNTKILNMSEPKLGDVVVFRWPLNTSIDYIKRIVGLPGDHIQYKKKVLYVNGVEAPQKLIEHTMASDGNGRTWKVEKREETLNGVKHLIYVRPDAPAEDFEVTIPNGSYFAMGDNRDDSADSRYWGFVRESDLVGKAFATWMSWNSETSSIRWQRIGKVIN